MTALAQLPDVDPATASERFAALLPRPGETRRDATREAACVQLLKVQPGGTRRACLNLVFAAVAGVFALSQTSLGWSIEAP